jgi:hypothetical protein
MPDIPPEASGAGWLSSRSAGTHPATHVALPGPAIFCSVNRRSATTVSGGSAGLADGHRRRTDRGNLSAGDCGLLPTWLNPRSADGRVGDPRFHAGQCE